MIKLTSFQEKCGDELGKVLRSLGHEARKWEVVKGREETYVEVDLGQMKV